MLEDTVGSDGPNENYEEDSEAELQHSQSHSAWLDTEATAAADGTRNCQHEEGDFRFDADAISRAGLSGLVGPEMGASLILRKRINTLQQAVYKPEAVRCTSPRSSHLSRTLYEI